MPPATLPENEAERIAVLRSFGVLDTPPEPVFDAITRLASQLCRTPIALVVLVDEDRQWFKSRHGVSFSQTQRSDAFCAHTILSPAPLVVSDAAVDPRFVDSAFTWGPPYARFYLGIPLVTTSGHILGTLCVVDTAPRVPDLDTVEALQVLARGVIAHLELRKRAQDLSRLAEELARATHAKSRFIANVSHELRTPLAGAAGMLELALNATLPPDARDYVHGARSSIESLRHIVDDMLDLSRAESGRVPVTVAPFRVATAVEDALITVRARAREKGLGLGVVFDDGVPPRVLGDMRLLRQILVNLLGNAVKFTEQGAVTVRVSPGASGQVHFSVEDTGIGVPEDRLEAIFEPFTQADETTTRRFGGTGLGLSIARELAQALAGDLTVRSALDVGSVFTCSLPLLPAPAAGKESNRLPALRLHRPPTVPPTVAPPTPPPGILRVLLAEDSPVNARFAKVLLQKAGHAVVHVADGAQAVRVATAPGEHFDVILMDVQMPELDGTDAARAIRAAELQAGRPRVPIVALTASAMPGDAEACFAAGMDGHLNKPFDARTLLSAIDEVLGRGVAAAAPVELH